MLAEAGVGTLAGERGWAIYAIQEPTSPDTCITVYDTGGFPPTLNRDPVRAPTVQVRVRGTVGGYRAAYAKVHEAVTQLHGRCRQVRGATEYMLVRQMSDVAFLEVDEKGRPVLVVNFMAYRQGVK